MEKIVRMVRLFKLQMKSAIQRLTDLTMSRRPCNLQIKMLLIAELYEHYLRDLKSEQYGKKENFRQSVCYMPAVYALLKNA